MTESEKSQSSLSENHTRQGQASAPEDSGSTVQSSNWHDVIGQEKTKNYFQQLMSFIKTERAQGKTIYPEPGCVFNAFKQTPFAQLKVVILGQDPYHRPGQAHGLAFSVRPEMPVPPSLKNIYKELYDELGIKQPDHGFLKEWANQGVFLLNTVLTVEAFKAHSHAGQGWETFTDTVIQKINAHSEHVVFMLWGGHARKKTPMINQDKHLVLEASHPSPLSANRSFFGCGHFAKCNAYLTSRGHTPINWQLT